MMTANLVGFVVGIDGAKALWFKMLGTTEGRLKTTKTDFSPLSPILFWYRLMIEKLTDNVLCLWSLKKRESVYDSS